MDDHLENSPGKSQYGRTTTLYYSSQSLVFSRDRVLLRKGTPYRVNYRTRYPFAKGLGPTFRMIL